MDAASQAGQQGAGEAKHSTQQAARGAEQAGNQAAQESMRGSRSSKQS
jgi:hypothetical protein